MLVAIYETIYKSTSNQYIDIFLCGGMSTKDKISQRDSLREIMKDDDKLKILYPEDLFIELMNTNKKYDLLTLEQFLADNCDFICIVCESAGSLVELGAFTSNKVTLPKVIAMIEEKKKRNKSFIMLGPIKTIERKNKHNVIYYSPSKVEDLSQRLIKQIKSLHKKSSNIDEIKPINNIIGLYHFIPMVLYFNYSIEVPEILAGLKYLLVEHCKYELEDDEYDRLYKSSMKLLYKERYIIKEFKKGKDREVYRLTSMGYDYMHNILRNTKVENRTKLHDKITFDIMNDRYY